MGLSFGLKVLPGVRVRVGTRGIRTSVGPRMARVHVGGGAGVSSGVGPVSLYGSMGRRRRRSSSQRPAAMTVTQQRGLERAARAHERHARAYEVSQVWRQWTSAHLEEFPAAQCPVQLAPPEPDVTAIALQIERDLLADAPRLRRRRRAELRRQANEEASAVVEDFIARGSIAARERQIELNSRWRELLDNEPYATLDVLARALDDNRAFAAPVQIVGWTASLVMVAPPLSDLPESDAKQNAAGHWTTAKLPAGERNRRYLSMICSHVLATARESFAVAPGLREVKIAVVRDEGALRRGGRWVTLLVAVVERREIERAVWDGHIRAESLLSDIASAVAVRFHASGAKLMPLTVDDVDGLEKLTNWLDECSTDNDAEPAAM
jgi:hypothetical protein